MNALNPNDSILGYILKKRIGSGGYGEVWSAEAPGGIQKAIKFVYGYHDQQRAATELRSLDRIKSVRHPFLLSLEQILIHDGKLIVVTELAEKSLADLFNEYQSAGRYGVPRDEIVGYLRDAADGLDYLTQTHHLQHLDIKPENLLLLGGHIKIADFGLVKDLSCVTQSMMSGLTPAYAPPEIFDGRPHSNSDQYSLAIVYTEMLTGVRPFSGTTPAQLAAQHINSRPQLQSLPSGDQPVIARALSKDPSLRYPNCRAMADELFERKRGRALKKSAAPPPRREPTQSTFSLENRSALEVTAIVSNHKLPVQAGLVKYLDCLGESGDVAGLGPTLIIGVGRFGAHVVHQFRQRLEQRFGTLSRIPCLGLMAIDTDRQFLATLVDGDGRGGLDPSQTLPIQLKTAEQYRTQKKLRLDWISRRWIYNIPRSGQTEGLRPLGRLALADHFESIFRRLKDVAHELIKPENVALAAETSGLEPRPAAIRVVLVGAASGGVGSGTLIDLAYALRTLFSELGRQEIELLGILGHWTPRESDLQLLAIANSLSMLNEIRHLNRYGYPGDSGLGLPEFDEPVFDHTYVQHLGDALSASGLQTAARSTAEYLFLNTLSECGVFFEACRRERSSDDIRSAHIKYYGTSQPEMFERLRQGLAANLGKRWLETLTEPWPEGVQAAFDDAVARWGLTLNGVRQGTAAACRQLVGSLRERIDAFQILAKQNWTATLGAGRFEQLLNNLGGDSLVPCPAEPTDTDPRGREKLPAQGSWETRCQQQGIEIATQLAAAVATWVSTTNLRVNGSHAIVGKLVQTLRGLIAAQQEAVGPLAAVAEEQQAAFVELAARKRVTADKLSSAFDAWAAAYLEWRQAEAAATVIKWQLTPIIARLLEADSQLSNWLGVLRQWLPSEVAPTATGTLPNQVPTTQICWWLENHLSDLVGRVDNHLQQGWLQAVGGLSNVFQDPAGLGCRLEQAVQLACTDTLAAAENEMRLDQVIAAAGLSLETLTDVIGHELLTTFPRLRECGGEIRALIGFWTECFSSPDEARRILDYQSPRPTLVRHEHGDLVLCQEMQGIPLANLIFRLMENRADAVDLVSRLHARTDVHWSNLNEIFQQAGILQSR